MVFQEHRAEYLTKHTIPEVTLEDHCLNLPLLRFLSEGLKGLIGITIAEPASFHQIDVAIQGEQHCVTRLILTATTRVNHEDALLVLSSVLAARMIAMNIITLKTHVRKLFIAILTVRKPLVMHWGFLEVQTAHDSVTEA